MVKAHNADYIKSYNRKAVLRLLRHSPMSRADLARSTGLTRATTSLIADEMIKEGILTEMSPQKAGRGRRAMPLSICPDRYYSLGVFLSRNSYAVGLCNFSGELVCRREIVLSAEPVEDLVRALEDLLKQVDRSRVVGIGITSPGPLDTQQGKILNPPQFECWHGVSIAPVLTERMGIPAYLEHDACALALHQLEICESKNFLLLLVGRTGLGSGVVSDGRLLGGTGHFTGELGHTSIRFDGRRCNCGNKGCLETYAAINNLLEDSRFSTWRELVDAIGSEDANRLLDREGEYLAAGIINLLNLISVDTVYLSGEIRYGGEVLVQRLQKAVRERVMYRSYSDVVVRMADDNPKIDVLAACNVAFSRFLMA